MFPAALGVGLALFSGGALFRRWREPLDSPRFQKPTWLPYSETSFLGVCAGDAVTPFLWLTGIGAVEISSGLLGGVLMTLFAAAVALFAALYFLGRPACILPHAMRGVFRGTLRSPPAAGCLDAAAR